MREVGRAVFGLHRFRRTGQRGACVAAFEVGKTVVACKCGFECARDFVAADVGGRTFIPGDRVRRGGQGTRGLDRMPRCVGNHRDTAGRTRRRAAALQRHYLQHSRHRHHGGSVHALDTATQHGAQQQAGVTHAGQHRVDAEQCAAVDLGSGFDARGGFADQPPCGRWLQGWRCSRIGRIGHSRRGSSSRQLTESEAPTTARMLHSAIACLAFAGGHVPAARGFQHQCLARDSAGLPHRQPQVFDARRAAGQHQPDFARELGR